MCGVSGRCEDLPVEEEYLKELEKWMDSSSQFFQTKTEGLSICEKQLQLLTIKCSSIQLKRNEVQVVGRSISAQLRPEVKSLYQRAVKAQDALEKTRSRASTMVGRIEKMATDELQVRLAVQNMTRMGGVEKVRVMLLANVERNRKEAESVMAQVRQQFDSVVMSCDQLEKELEKEKEYADRKQLLQDINDIDQIYSSCVTVTSRDFKDFESIASSLTTMQKNFADFQNRMDEMRKERQRDSCSRSLSPRSVDNSEAATEVALPCIKGWTCTICGIVNDNSTVVCDGCFHRHICSVCWRECVGTSNVNSMPLKTNKSCSILLKSGSNSGGR